MRRREFVTLLGSTALTRPLATRAPQSRVARIGALYLGIADAESFRKGLREGLRELGCVEGRDVEFEFRSAEERLDRLPELAAELVRRKVDVIVALYVPCALAAKQPSRCGGQAYWAMPQIPYTRRRCSSKFNSPAASTPRAFADIGGLMSFGADGPATFRHGAFFVHRIPKGKQPQDMPIEQPTKFELAVNLKTAKAIGLAIPKTFLQRADTVLE